MMPNSSTSLLIDVTLSEDSYDGGKSPQQFAESPLEVSASSTASIMVAAGQLRHKTEEERSNHLTHKLFPIERLLIIGKGSSAIVYKSVHLSKLMVVAEKVVVAENAVKRQQLVSELKSLGTILKDSPQSCPYIVQLLDVLTNPADGTISVCLEFMDGGSLQDIVTSGGCKDEIVLAGIARQILQGVAFLHSKRHIHRDIKPGNLLIDGQGAVKISDFGLAREMQQGHSLAETFVGTFCYMAPERIGAHPYSFSSDIWSVGLSVMACAMGRYPYAVSTDRGYWALLQAIMEQPVPILNTNIGAEDRLDGMWSSEFTSFVESCCRKSPEERPTALELLTHPFLGISTISSQVLSIDAQNPQATTGNSRNPRRDADGQSSGRVTDQSEASSCDNSLGHSMKLETFSMSGSLKDWDPERSITDHSASWLLQRKSSNASLKSVVTDPHSNGNFDSTISGAIISPKPPRHTSAPPSQAAAGYVRRNSRRKIVSSLGIAESRALSVENVSNESWSGGLSLAINSDYQSTQPASSKSERGRTTRSPRRPPPVSSTTLRIVSAIQSNLLQHWSVGLQCSLEDPPLASLLNPAIGGKDRLQNQFPVLCRHIGVSEEDLRNELGRMLSHMREGIMLALHK